MKVIATHYGDHDISWIPEYSKGDYLIYDRSECGLPNRIPRENLGDADFDRLTYIIDNYYDLPDIFVLTKSNLFKFITPEEWDKLKVNTDFTPLLTQNHPTYSDDQGVVCYYQDGMYYERADSWFLGSVPAMYVKSWQEWTHRFFLPDVAYIPFFPGGNCILTRERVHRYGLAYYEEMAALLPYCQHPGEAHCVERSLYLMWG